MKESKNKLFCAITIVLMLTATMLMVSMQSAVNAQVTNARNTEWDLFLYAIVAPNPVGVNQQVLVTFQTDKVNPIASIRANLWEGFMVTITRPDGKIETKGPFEGYSTGGAYFSYVPTIEGTYYFQCSFPGQWVNGSYTDVGSPGGNWQNITGHTLIIENRWYKPAVSDQFALTVQHDPILAYPNVPLPTGYWTTPIYGENKGWSQVSDSWLMQGYEYTRRSYTALSATSAFAPYTSAPNSAHILWNLPIQFGGMVGGPYGDKVYYTGLTYEQYYTPLIVGGRIIYTVHGPTSTAPFGTRCLDLYTGDEVWYLNNTDISFAQLFDFESGNEHGILPYLWSTSGSSSNGTWLMYDAFTGIQILTVINVPTGSRGLLGSTIGFGPSGEILSYVLDSTNNRLFMWNSTLAIVGNIADTWSPAKGGVIDGQRGVQWNVSIPDVPGFQSVIMLNIKDGYMLAAYQDPSTYPNVYVNVAYNLNVARLGNGSYPSSINQMWVENRTNIYGHYPLYSENIQDGVYIMWDLGKAQLHGYDIKTGQELWVSDPITASWGFFTRHFIVAYNKIYTTGFDGHVRAYDAKNGSLVWDFFMGNSGYETPYGTWPSSIGCTVADGKVYVTNDEHSPDSVMWRGGKIWAFDAETGKCLWNMSGWLRVPAVSNGYLTSCNALDNQVYTIGKGPSATTVTTPDMVSSLGTAIMIKGTVTDQSPGQKDTGCISDADMSSWMEYLHMQKPKPTNASGVQIRLTAIDSNGNIQEIGNVTSDTNGNFGIMWVPPIEGQYKVTATFEGTNSYGSSEATAYLGVGPAIASPAPTAMPTATLTANPTAIPTPTTSPSVVPTGSGNPGIGAEVYIAIAAVIIIVAIIVAAVILRRRK